MIIFKCIKWSKEDGIDILSIRLLEGKMQIWKEKARGIDSPLESFKRHFGPQDNLKKRKNLLLSFLIILLHPLLLAVWLSLTARGLSHNADWPPPLILLSDIASFCKLPFMPATLLLVLRCLFFQSCCSLFPVYSIFPSLMCVFYATQYCCSALRYYCAHFLSFRCVFPNVLDDWISVK